MLLKFQCVLNNYNSPNCYIIGVTCVKIFRYSISKNAKEKPKNIFAFFIMEKHLLLILSNN